jgi:hypothetical protein
MKDDSVQNTELLNNVVKNGLKIQNENKLKNFWNSVFNLTALVWAGGGKKFKLNVPRYNIWSSIFSDEQIESLSSKLGLQRL